MVWRRAAHSAYDTAYHLVWSPKYRKGLLRGELARRVEQLFREIAEAHDITIEELEVSADHVHIFCSFPPRYAIAQVVGQVAQGADAGAAWRGSLTDQRSQLPSRNHHQCVEDEEINQPGRE